MSRRVLLLYITEHSGHHKASMAIEKSLKMLDPSTEVMSVSSFNYTNPILEKIINRTYNSIIKRTPEVWEYIYDNPKIIKNTHAIKDAIHKYNSKKLKNLVDNFRPDVVVATQAFPCGMVADLKKSFNLKMALVGVVTDFYPHSYWMYDACNAYVVASQEAKDRFVQDGIPQEKVNIFGIPIDSKFHESKPKDKIAAKLGLDKSKPVVLIMGGGQGLGPIKAIVSSIQKSSIDLQMIVVCGINDKLHKYFLKKSKKYKKRLIPLGYCDYVDELMEVSDLVVSKPGGITVSEALAKSLPILIINPIPGQEANNAKFLMNSGVGIKAENTTDLITVLENLFSMPTKLESMKRAADRIAKPKSSIDTASMILRI